jgi:hypothetical protein
LDSKLQDIFKKREWWSLRFHKHMKLIQRWNLLISNIHATSVGVGAIRIVAHHAGIQDGARNSQLCTTILVTLRLFLQ